MEEFIRSMMYPFFACLLIAGIHVYLGIHVIERKVIFVDLALAQIAAFGAVYGVLLGYSLLENPWAIKSFSLAFALVGTAIFSLTRMRYERVPQEATIGITYAAALAATILASSHLPHGAEEVRELLVGSILWIKGETILYTAILYAGIGSFYYAFGQTFLRISLDPKKAEEEGVSILLWDFLFYATFGLVITTSVAIAGVILVFSYLVIPAAVAVLFADRIRTRLVIGWCVGTLVSFIGVVISYVKDLPSGPTIVISLAASLIIAAVAHFILYSTSKKLQIFKTLAGGMALVLFIGVTLLFRHHDVQDPLQMATSQIKNERLIALRAVEEDPNLWKPMRILLPNLLHDPEPEVRSMTLGLVGQYKEQDYINIVYELLTDSDDRVREAALRCVRSIGDIRSIEPLLESLSTEDDDYIKVETAKMVLELGDPRSIPFLINVMDQGEATQVRKEAYEHISAHLPVHLPFHADLPPEENNGQIEAFRQWWLENMENLGWQPDTKVFEVRE